MKITKKLTNWNGSCFSLSTVSLAFFLLFATFLIITFLFFALFTYSYMDPIYFVKCSSLLVFSLRKVLNREAWSLCRGSWHSKIWQKIHWFIVFHSSILGVWEFVWWGINPSKPPLTTELVTNRHLFQKLYYQIMPNSSQWEQHLF